MREYGFSLTRILPYKDKVYDFYPYTGEHWSVKTRILAYFMQCISEGMLFQSMCCLHHSDCFSSVPYSLKLTALA